MPIVSLVLLFHRCCWCLGSPYWHGFAALAVSVTGAAGVSGATFALRAAVAQVSWVPLGSRVPLKPWVLLLSWVLILGVLCNKLFEDTSVPFSKRRPVDMPKGQWRRSKFDVDPDDVNVSSIVGVIMGTDVESKIEEPEETEETEEKEADEESDEKEHE